MVRKEPKGSRDEEPEYVPKNSKKDYMWFEMGFFTRWERPDRCRVLCIDTPEKLQSRLETVLREQSPLKFSDPFAMHVPLIDQIILLYDVSVWRVRDPVRKIEKVSTSITLLEGVVDKCRLGQRERERTKHRSTF